MDPLNRRLLSTNLGLVYVEPNNYARAGSTLPETLDQVNSFALPSKPQLSLYCVMMGGTAAINNEPTWARSVRSDILSNSNLVSRLYARGARAIMVESQLVQDPNDRLPFGTNPDLQAEYDSAYASLNAGFRQAMDVFSKSHLDLRFYFVDMFSKLDDILAHPAQFGFTKTDIGALADPTLTDKSFDGPGANYLFWDNNHFTAKLHQLIASGWLEMQIPISE